MRIASASATSSHSDEEFIPENGNLTWQSEGRPSGRFASRGIHWPGGDNSGVTIGRGYDMGSRSAADIIKDLQSAGVSLSAAKNIAQSAGLKGIDASIFVQQNKGQFPALTAIQELKLFSQVTYPRYVAEAERLATKSDVQEAYGSLNFKAMDPAHRELLVDLLYRGDYTPTTRAIIQKAFVAGDKSAICQALSVITDQKSVPADRASRRQLVIGCEE